MSCSFCSVSSFFGRSYRRRPTSQVIEEIKAHKKKLLIFADDNIAGNPDSAKELFAAMIPLKKKWVSQCSLSIADDPELLDLAARSGCIGLLIGFESISPEVLKSIGKRVNLQPELRRGDPQDSRPGSTSRPPSSSGSMRTPRTPSPPRFSS